MGLSQDTDHGNKKRPLQREHAGAGALWPVKRAGSKRTSGSGPCLGLTAKPQQEIAAAGVAMFEGAGLLRQSPAPIPLRHHGNWVHGRYSKAHMEEMRLFRRCVKIIRARI